MCKREPTEFLAELTESAAELSEFSPPKQYSRNSIPPVLQGIQKLGHAKVPTSSQTPLVSAVVEERLRYLTFPDGLT